MRKVERRHRRREWRRQKAVSVCLGVGLVCVGLAAVAPGWAKEKEEEYRKKREEMVRAQIASPRWTGMAAVRNERVLAAMRKVPRHLFVPPTMAPHAYEDRPLPIGLDQTISQPYIVAKMTELLDPKPAMKVLEIGTGSGYQAAVLSELVREVYTIEIVEPLGKLAERRLAELGYKNVHVRIGDGYKGWPEESPFDGIMVTAAAEKVPPALVEQIAPGGKLVIPVGRPNETQMLTIVERGRANPRDLRTREVMSVIFVPMTGEQQKK